jgi:hypothetical protein
LGEVANSSAGAELEEGTFFFGRPRFLVCAPESSPILFKPNQKLFNGQQWIQKARFSKSSCNGIFVFF